MKKKVIVGMSGGVDSSVSAYLLKEQGYEVTGLFMKNWEELDDRGQCTSIQDYEDVQKVCHKIDIPCYSVNFVKEYKENVFHHFLEELKKGHTPNPDILCNREIKFKAFLEKALSLGADFLATGHYSQISPSFELLRSKDTHKDQTYFLYTLSKEILTRVLFPIGHLTKKEVRKIAMDADLPTAAKKDSTGICFIGKRDFKEFISHYLSYQKGSFMTLCGKIVGEHDGAAFYTIGQRKGLGIGGPGDAWFVVRKDVEKNLVFVEQGEDHPSLYKEKLQASDLSWVAGAPPFPLPFACTAKIRYRAIDAPCTIESIHDGIATVCFDKEQRAITSRQSVVFYSNEVCLGGGMII